LPKLIPMTRSSTFVLRVQQIHQTCLFELTWGQGQRLTAELPYPDSVIQVYQDWQRAYLSFYTVLRGQVNVQGVFALPPINWHSVLVQAEAALMSEFHQWLRQAELYEIRNTITHSARSVTTTNSPSNEWTVNVFLCCQNSMLERLPWESWELGTNLEQMGIHIVRTADTIRHGLVQPRSGKTRILIIIGNDPKLNFETDLEMVKQKLSPIAEIVPLGWGLKYQGSRIENVQQLKQLIGDELSAKTGWDMLLFMGHSDESALTGGELAIAPNEWLSSYELRPKLLKAKEHGLAFALFNSCSGLDLARTMMDLGLSQVAVMREPIDNQVAQVFLKQFLHALTADQDVQEALQTASRYLKVETNLTYPSAHLIPSLFCHPDVPRFRMRPYGLKQRLKPWVTTTKGQAFKVVAVAGLSLLWPVQDLLLDLRVLAQAVYRDLGTITTEAISEPVQPQSPPVLLVQIDEDSLEKKQITNPRPMNRRYLAQLVKQAAQLKPTVIGIDYLLNQPQPDGDSDLAAVVQDTVDREGTWFIFAASLSDANASKEVNRSIPEVAISHLSLQGYINSWHRYVELPDQSNCDPVCPFAYLLAIAQTLSQSPNFKGLGPQLDNQNNLQSRVVAAVSQNRENSKLQFLQQAQLSPLSKTAHHVGQAWLTPIVDFSIPRGQVFRSVPAWQMLAGELEHCQSSLSANSGPCQPIVIIGPGGYEEAGVDQQGEDNSSAPFAVWYWRKRLNLPQKQINQPLTGAEIHAYAAYQLLKQRLVIAVPDLWLIGLSVVLGKGVTLILAAHPQQQCLLTRSLVVLTLLYGVSGLYIYQVAGVLLPWLLPSITFWLYILPSLEKKAYDST
jgi:CHASE2 domain-containing sensor protein